MSEGTMDAPASTDTTVADAPAGASETHPPRTEVAPAQPGDSDYVTPTLEAPRSARVCAVWHDGACATYHGVPMTELGVQMAELVRSGAVVTWMPEY